MSRLAPLLQVFRRSMSAAAARGRPPPRKPNRTDSPPPSTTTAAPAVAAPTDDEVYTILGTKLHIANHPPSVVAALSVDNGSNIEQRRARKQDIIHRFRRSESDTGSPEVQSKFYSSLSFFCFWYCFVQTRRGIFPLYYSMNFVGLVP